MSEEKPNMEVLEDAGVAFDPTAQHLDLSKEEKRRTTALMLAITAYKELIIKDADYLREVANLARNDDFPAIRPATIDAMVETAIKFDNFIAKENDTATDEQTKGGSQTETAGRKKSSRKS